jgi:hypothetical protein
VLEDNKLSTFSSYFSEEATRFAAISGVSRNYLEQSQMDSNCENHAEAWSQRIPSTEDIKDLRALLQYADLNVNMCSTMSLILCYLINP